MMLKVDMTSAFNTVHRLSVLQSALAYWPAAFNYLNFAYRAPGPLFVGGQVLASETGTHQGCPLGPLWFALAIQPILEDLADRSELIWSSWYLDDGILIGSPEKVADAFGKLSIQLGDRGLAINAAKCEAWGPRTAPFALQHPTVPQAPWEPDSGTKVLGCPINYPQSTGFSDRLWQSTCKSLDRAVQHVTQVTGLQVAHHLLRSTLDGCKVTHLLRATDCYKSDAGVKEADAIILSGFEDIVGGLKLHCLSVQEAAGSGLLWPSDRRRA